MKPAEIAMLLRTLSDLEKRALDKLNDALGSRDISTMWDQVRQARDDLYCFVQSWRAKLNGQPVPLEFDATHMDEQPVVRPGGMPILSLVPRTREARQSDACGQGSGHQEEQASADDWLAEAQALMRRLSVARYNEGRAVASAFCADAHDERNCRQAGEEAVAIQKELNAHLLAGRRAFEIADESMLERLASNAVRLGESRYGLCDASQHEVRSLAEADPEISDAVAWLQPSGLVSLQQDEGGVVVLVRGGEVPLERAPQRPV